jgi:hypothetical protein
MVISLPLPESTVLPSAWSTRQSLKNTRQSLCRVSHSAKSASAKPSLPSTFLGHLAKLFTECQRALGKEKQSLRRRVTETASLPSVCLTALGKESARGVPMSGTLPSAWYDTRQRVLLCQVPEPLHSAKNLYWCPALGSLPSVMVLTLGKVTSTHLFYLFSLFHPNKQKIFHRYHIYTSEIITDIYSQHKQY